MAMSNALGGGIRGQSYLGTNAKNPANVVYARRNPESDDIAGYALGTLWINLVNSSLWALVNVEASLATAGEQVATWSQLNASDSSGSMQLLQTQTASAVATLDFTTGISSTYTNYLLIFNKINCPLAATTDLFVQLSINGGLSYITSGYRNNVAADNGLQLTNVTDGTSLCYGTAYLYNVTSGAGHVSSNTGATVASPGVNSLGSGSNATYETPNITVNALRVVTASGAVYSGIVSLYGITQ